MYSSKLAMIGPVVIFFVVFAKCNSTSINKIHPKFDYESGDSVLKLNKGSLLGKRMVSREGREYLAFLGVPYAKPPLGELRFLPPLPNDPWNGTLNATEFKPDCIQKDKYNPEIVTKGSEDCLYINVYTPKKTMATLVKEDANPFPVMVYFHGGGPYGSGSRYGAEYFMDQDVILITVLYRLGVMGNLNTNDSESRGNQGLKDQVMVLQWTRENIDKFGGNHKKVTIFGNSYGSMAVSAHLMSPMSSGLFHRAICQSGEQISPGILTQNPLNNSVELAKKLNCTWNSTKDIVNCFRNVNADTLVLSSYDMPFTTSVEPAGPIDDTVLPDAPLKLLQTGQLYEGPIMIGGASGEGLSYSLPILSTPELTNFFNDNWETAAIEALALRQTPGLKDPARIANAAREFYFGSANISRKTEGHFTALFSDRTFIHPAALSADLHLQNRRPTINQTQNSIYLYYFNKESDKSYADPALEQYGAEEFLGAGHADELQYLFPYESFPYISQESKDFKFSKLLVRLWVAFAETGNPNGAEWQPLSQKPFRWFKLDEEPRMIDFLGARMKFWDSFNSTDLYV